MLAKYLLVNGLLAAVVGVVGGAACWLFMHGLTLISKWREAGAHWPWLGLPLAGVVCVWLYQRWGKGLESGNNVLLEQVHTPKKPTPLRMSWLILSTTWLGHLCGASVGREGTGVQIGGCLADNLAALFGCSTARRRLLLIAGIAAGFAGVFGTPMAAALFGVEVLMVGGLGYAAMYSALVAAMSAYFTCNYFGLEHAHYHQGSVLAFEPLVALRVILLAILCAMVARMFVSLMNFFSAYFARMLPNALWRSAFAGLVMCAALWLLGGKYAGLGVATIEAGFVQTQGLEVFAIKLILTAFCLSCGFKGGEVTPLFFVGATLGSAVALYVGLPLDVAAAIGFITVFCAASNTPLTCSVMAIELFGAQNAPAYMLACVVAYVMSGHSSIYRAQLRGKKLDLQFPL